MKQKIFTVVGGDMRLVHLLALLRQRPFCAQAHGIYLDKTELPANAKDTFRRISAEEALSASDVVIFGLTMLDAEGNINAPLAYRNPDIGEIFHSIRPDTLLFGGAIPQPVITKASQQGVAVVDYMLREEFAVRNAIPTAEGAVEFALRERESTLYGANCLVLGYGRIGKMLTRLLVAFGAKTAVAARKPSDLEWISVAGGRPIHTQRLDSCLADIDIVFNTVPALLLDEGRLARLKKDCLIIDLASKPGGVDFDAAKRLDLHVEWALSLPGKLAPVSAGEIILDTITNILAERGLLYE